MKDILPFVPLDYPVGACVLRGVKMPLRCLRLLRCVQPPSGIPLFIYCGSRETSQSGESIRTN
ncbi:hypothetical protein [Chryseobacterium koreense]